MRDSVIAQFKELMERLKAKQEEIQTLQRMVLEAFEMRFPALKPWAATQITGITERSDGIDVLV